MICDYKNRYNKKEALSMRNYRESQGEVNLRVYQCKYCNFWHLTHKDRWGSRIPGKYYKRKRSRNWKY